MNIDKIIVLKNKKRYYLMDKIEVDGVNYFYAVGVYEDSDELNENYVFIKENIYEGKVYAEEVQDESMKKFLLTVFLDQFIDDVEENK